MAASKRTYGVRKCAAEGCGKEFVATSPSERSCGRKCSKKLHRQYEQISERKQKNREKAKRVYARKKAAAEQARFDAEHAKASRAMSNLDEQKELLKLFCTDASAELLVIAAGTLA